MKIQPGSQRENLPQVEQGVEASKGGTVGRGAPLEHGLALNVDGKPGAEGAGLW